MSTTMIHDDDTKQLFLDNLANCGVVSAATQAAGIKSAATVYRWRREDPEFSAAYDEAMETAADSLEMEARRRAVEGVTRVKFSKSGEPYDVIVYSDTLLLALLKAKKSDQFADRSKTEITSPDGSLKPVNETASAARLLAILEAAKQRRDGEALENDPLFD